MMDEYERAVANKLHALFPSRSSSNVAASVVSTQNIVARVMVNLFKGVWVGAGFYLARFLLMTGRLYSWTGFTIFKPPPTSTTKLTTIKVK